MVSGRQAAGLLRDVLASDEQARILLRTGIAGGLVTSRGVLFDDAAVRALRLRPLVDEHELGRVCPHGLFVARLPRTEHLDLRISWDDTAAQVTCLLSRQRPMTVLTAALIGVRVRVWGPLPFAATLLGYVVLTADLVSLDGPRLAPPGAWAGALDGRRFLTTRGGRPGQLWLPPGEATLA